MFLSDNSEQPEPKSSHSQTVMTAPVVTAPINSAAVIIVTDQPKQKKITNPKKTNVNPPHKPQNLFSDETAIFLLRLIKGNNTLPQKIVLPVKVRYSETAQEKQLPPKQPPKQPQQQPDIQEELATAIREILLPWFWSFLFHLCLFIFLALLFFQKTSNDSLTILSGIDEIPMNLIRDFPLGSERLLLEVPTLIVPQELPPVEMPKAVPLKLETVLESESVPATDNSPEMPTGFSLASREIGSRANILGKGGGSNQTDESVIAALRWLVRVQMPNGSWSLSGPYRDAAPRNRDNRNAATAMALLAFQGYGVTPDAKHPQLIEFSKSVRTGWDWLILQQNPEDGCFFREGLAHYEQRFYTHGLCTIALCELLAMTQNQAFREPAQRAIDYCLKHQSIEGGWRYRADRFGSGSDVSVTGWIVLALRSGEAAGLSVPLETYQNIMKYLDLVSRNNGSQYIYREQEPEFRISMTAEALLCRELLGWKRNDQRLEQGIQILIRPEHQPTFEDHYKRDAYYWFYATQTLHYFGGEPWKIWNNRMRELLVQHQEKQGTNTGSWNPNLPVQDKWGTHYGRLYTTCLLIYILEVYYRNSNIYTITGSE
ncbi:MAG: terpene cyclase/mutase family protein [Planctomycetaceae bacterium]|jgi:hypothetical protein|nr:terpene cyclase/mutase family protein [Planctomycetaceae bacterium]